MLVKDDAPTILQVGKSVFQQTFPLSKKINKENENKRIKNRQSQQQTIHK